MKVTTLSNWNIKFEAETDEDERPLLALLHDEDCRAIFERNLCEALTKWAEVEAGAAIRGTNTPQKLTKQ